MHGIQTLPHNVVSSTPRYKQGSKLTTLVVTGSCKSNYNVPYNHDHDAPKTNICQELKNI
jgi:hypothetical protein